MKSCPFCGDPGRPIQYEHIAGPVVQVEHAGNEVDGVDITWCPLWRLSIPSWAWNRRAPVGRSEEGDRRSGDSGPCSVRGDSAKAASLTEPLLKDVPPSPSVSPVEDSHAKIAAEMRALAVRWRGMGHRVEPERYERWATRIEQLGKRHWESEAERYAANADYWRQGYETLEAETQQAASRTTTRERVEDAIDRSKDPNAKWESGT